MSDPTEKPAKPGTACLGCRRRKLKCSRDLSGCTHCARADLPCVYPTAEVGVRRKRGPYNKDKPSRERHLEELVKYLEPKSSTSDSAGSAKGANARNTGGRTSEPSTASSEDASTSTGTNNASNPEELVKDALIALTRSSIPDRQALSDEERPRQSIFRNTPASVAMDLQHPPIKRVLQYWHLFLVRIDPLTKVIHCPTFQPTLFAAIEDLNAVPRPLAALLFSIYFAAVSCCTVREAQESFGEPRNVLMRRYGQCVEWLASDDLGLPSMQSVQALIIYVISIRRQDDGTNVRAFLSLAIRMGQLIRLQEEPGEEFSPFEAEMRRRLWWHICGLDTRTAEDQRLRTTSLINDVRVKQPGNFNDRDLHVNLKHLPKPRVGMADFTFTLMRFEVQQLTFRLWICHRESQSNSVGKRLADKTKAEQKKIYREVSDRLQSVYTNHFDVDKPFEWMVKEFVQGMMLKAHLVIDFPMGQVPTKAMTGAEREELLRASIALIRGQQTLAFSEIFSDWFWFFRYYTQWHAFAIVVTELSWSTNSAFAAQAWAAVNPILADWDSVYNRKRDDPAWDHVNTIIERARLKRKQQALQNPAPTADPVVSTDPIPPGAGFCSLLLHSSLQLPFHHSPSNAPPADPFPSASLNNTTLDPNPTYPTSTLTPQPYPGGECTNEIGGFDIDYGLEEDYNFDAFDAVFGNSNNDLTAGSWLPDDWSFPAMELDLLGEAL